MAGGWPAPGLLVYDGLMCGRYSIVRGDRIVSVIPNVTVPSNLRLLARYNAAPSQNLPVIASAPGEVQMFRWGLIPSWAKDQKVGYKMINARAETLAEKPAFREPLRHRRCLVPADGFYEWRKEPGGGKSPIYIRLRDSDLFAFAGLWDAWRNPSGELIRSFTIITTPPNALLKPIHNRMPAIVPREGYGDWLERGSTEWLRPYPAEQMQAHEVSTRVNNVHNDAPDLIESLPEESGPPENSPRPNRQPSLFD